MTTRFVKINIKPNTRRIAKAEASKNDEKLYDWLDKVVKQSATGERRKRREFKFF